VPHSLAEIVFWLSVACCLVAQVSIVRSVLAARRLPAVRPDLPRANAAVELMWAVVPGIALAVLLLFTWRAIGARDVRGTAPATIASPSGAAVLAEPVAAEVR
jgi:heme/copper-type cytochrome/quinol oxidase subunit 2